MARIVLVTRKDLFDEKVECLSEAGYEVTTTSHHHLISSVWPQDTRYRFTSLVYSRRIKEFHLSGGEIRTEIPARAGAVAFNSEGRPLLPMMLESGGCTYTSGAETTFEVVQEDGGVAVYRYTAQRSKPILDPSSLSVPTELFSVATSRLPVRCVEDIKWYVLPEALREYLMRLFAPLQPLQPPFPGKLPMVSATAPTIDTKKSVAAIGSR